MFVKAWIVLIAYTSLCQSIDAVKRIKDGQKVVRGDFTFTANIKSKGSTVCTAILVDRRWILTLKNCIKERSLRQYTVYFTTSKDRKVKRTLRYVEFPDSKDDSVILVRLKKKLRRSEDNVRPFDRFISSNNDMKLTNCKTVGFAPNGNVLNEVEINIQPAKSCRDSEKKTTLCFDTEGKVCKVDNGAPILCKLNKRDKKWYLTGLSSVTKTCKGENISGIRLAFFRKNIIKTINGKRKAPDCGTVPIIPFGTAQLDIPMETDVGSTATVSCQSGYETDIPILTCQEDGMWSATTCDKIDCGTVPIIPFGTAQLDIPMETDFGSTATVSCQSGYETDIPILTCQEDGMWSATTCDEIVAVNASLGEPCKLDRDCIDANTSCSNGFCACESGTANVSRVCTACAASTSACFQDLVLSPEVDECIVCIEKDFVKKRIVAGGGILGEVLNRGSQCLPLELPYESSCTTDCEGNSQCFWVSTDSLTSCINYPRECKFRLTKTGNTQYRFGIPG